jgi:hypothetical protein
LADLRRAIARAANAIAHRYPVTVIATQVKTGKLLQAAIDLLPALVVTQAILGNRPLPEMNRQYLRVYISREQGFE